MYIDYANIVRWQSKLGWHYDLRRLKKFFDSFDTVREVKFYNGTIEGDTRSESLMTLVKDIGYTVVTKPVKVMRLSVNVSSIPSDSPDILKNFIRLPFLRKLKIETVEALNRELAELNKRGVLWLEDLKCNFDVEIGVDMNLDLRKGIQNFVLWSGDSDFCDPLCDILSAGKRAVLFGTARRIASELNELTSRGLMIYETRKLRDFICFTRERRP